VSEVCRNLGITSGSLYKWIKLYGDASSQHQHITEKQDELRQLRAELRRVTEERDILKKAAVDLTGQCNIMHTGNYRGFQRMPQQVLKIRGLTSQQNQELWARSKKGQSLTEIGRALGKHAGSITGMLAIHGGIAPLGRSRSAVSGKR
jgi:hypothetical protein